MEINRSEINRALAKAIAYKACGKQGQAEGWARQLVRQLGLAGILAPCEDGYSPVDGYGGHAPRREAGERL